jgi:RNA polymerase sigma factor (sigma-70 family)
VTNEQLVGLHQRGDKYALEELIKQNKGIIHMLISRFKGSCESNKSIDVDDLFQEGCMGLMMAADKYDFKYIERCKFISYAIFWINQKIYRYFKYQNRSETSLNTLIGEEQDTELLDMIADESNCEDKVVESMYNKDLRKDLYSSMDKVNTLMEKQTLELNFGLNNRDPIGAADIAILLDINEQNITQIKKRALHKLRHSQVFYEYKNYYMAERYSRKYKNVDTFIETTSKDPLLKHLQDKYIKESALLKQYNLTGVKL